MIFLAISFAILGGIGRRVAGGALGQWWPGPAWGDTGPRLSFGVIVAGAALAGGALWWHALALILTTFIGCTIPNFGGIGIGREPGGSAWRDAGGLALHGAIGAALPAAGAWWLGYHAWWLFPAAGLSIAPLYWAGWIATGARSNLAFPLGFQQGSEIGEAAYGAAVALAALYAGA